MDRENEVQSAQFSLPSGGGGASGSSSNSERPEEIKAPVRDDFARQPERRHGRKLRTLVSAAAVLGVGWLMGLNSQFDVAQSKAWLDEGAIKLGSAFTSLQRGFVDRLEHLNGRYVSAGEPSTPVEKPNNADALERVADSLSVKLDQMRASAEALTRNVNIEVERLRGTLESGHGDLAAKITQLAERVDRLEQQTRPLAPPAPVTEHTTATSPTAPTPPPAPRLATTPERPKVVPPPAQAETRREPLVIKQWRVREVLNGTALLEGPGGLIGVSRGEMVPGIGRVESIVRSGNRWVVATSKGVITGN
jgi:hypothetical protein